MGKILIMLATSAFAGCSFLLPVRDYCTPRSSHSCPKPGHGPCYLCDAAPKADVLSEVR